MYLSIEVEENKPNSILCIIKGFRSLSSDELEQCILSVIINNHNKYVLAMGEGVSHSRLRRWMSKKI